MKNKTKNIEVRLYNEKSSKIRIDDIIKLKLANDENKYVLVKVKNLITYENVDDFLEKFDLKMAIKVHNKENALDTLYNIFVKEEVDTQGLKAKYYHDGIEELYDSLNKLIESRDLVNKLLLSIVATKESFEYNYEKNNEHTKKLLKNYQQVKRYQ